MDEKKIPRIVGKPDRLTPQNDLEHFMRCPVCGVVFDMRRLDKAFEHLHDGVKIDLIQSDKK